MNVIVERATTAGTSTNYLEEVNAGRMLPGATGKDDVSRQIEAAPSTPMQTPLLKAA